MQVLHDHGFPVPQPIDQSRHCLIMELIDAFPLCVPSASFSFSSPSKLIHPLSSRFRPPRAPLARLLPPHLPLPRPNLTPHPSPSFPPSRQISAVPSPGHLYSNLMDLIVRLARSGLIHGDFNEFNLLIRDHRTEEERARDDESDEDREDRIEREGGDFPVKVELEGEEWDERRRREREGTLLEPVLIDFPQMVSVDHADAE